MGDNHQKLESLAKALKTHVDWLQGHKWFHSAYSGYDPSGKDVTPSVFINSVGTISEAEKKAIEQKFGDTPVKFVSMAGYSTPQSSV